MTSTRALPLDGGWGWVVVFAGAMTNCLIDGSVACYGLFYPEILMDFRSSAAVTALPGSLICGVAFTACHVVGSLVERFGCRTVCFVGGWVSCLGLLLSSLTKSIIAFILTYGVIGGIGLGLTFIPCHVIVNLYFSKRRGIAQGLVSAGAGFGVFVMAPLTQFLIGQYSWRGAMLILSGVVFNFCVFAILMRPLPETECRDSDANSYTSEELDESECTKDVSKRTALKVDLESPLFLQPLLEPQSNGTTKGDNLALTPSRRIDQKGAVRGFLTPEVTRRSENGQQACLMTGNGLKRIETESNSLPNLAQTANGHQETHPHPAHHRHPPNPLLRKDIFYSGSLYHLKEFTSQHTVREYVDSMTMPDTVSEQLSARDEGCLRSTGGMATHLGKHLCDCSVFRHKIFLPILVGGVLIQMSQYIPLTYIGAYGLSINLTKNQISSLVSIYGGLNILGRLSGGVIVNLRWLSALWLCNISLAMCGLACLLFPLCRNFVTLCIFVVFLGYFIGYFAPLQVLILVDYIGLDSLTSSLGVLQMVKGPAAMAGPPLAGAVYEWTGDYSLAILFAGVLSILACMVQSLVPLINKHCSCDEDTGEERVSKEEINGRACIRNHSIVIEKEL